MGKLKFSSSLIQINKSGLPLTDVGLWLLYVICKIKFMLFISLDIKATMGSSWYLLATNFTSWVLLYFPLFLSFFRIFLFIFMLHDPYFPLIEIKNQYVDSSQIIHTSFFFFFLFIIRVHNFLTC